MALGEVEKHRRMATGRRDPLLGGFGFQSPLRQVFGACQADDAILAVQDIRRAAIGVDMVLSVGGWGAAVYDGRYKRRGLLPSWAMTPLASMSSCAPFSHQPA
jgi:hypothetical protein